MHSELFSAMLHDASLDSHASMVVVEMRTQGRDHPVLIGVPETSYLKCAILRRLQ
jgi:23S rRNA (cytosine1962-C5)-methyltransferase